MKSPVIILFLFSWAQAWGQVIHIQEVYKTVDTCKLAVDIFYKKETLEKEDNTAIVFFHGGRWAFGTPGEFFITCERYSRMAIVAFSVDYHLSVKNGDVPHPTISPIESVMDAKSAMRWMRGNAAKFHIDRKKIVAAGQSAGGHLALATTRYSRYFDDEILEVADSFLRKHNLLD